MLIFRDVFAMAPSSRPAASIAKSLVTLLSTKDFLLETFIMLVNLSYISPPRAAVMTGCSLQFRPDML
jgi:hypothetical protein